MRSLSVGSDGNGNPATINHDLRFQHIYVIGKTGKGKSVLIRNFIAQDSWGDHAIISIDPSGMESREILGAIDDNRTIRYCSLKSPLSLNPLTNPFRQYILKDTLVEIIDQAITDTTSNVKMTVGMRKALDYELEQELKKKHPSLLRICQNIEAGTVGNKSEDAQSARRLANRLVEILSDKEFNNIIDGPNSIDFNQVIENGEILIIDCKDMSHPQMLFLGNLIVKSLTSYYMHTEKKEWPPAALYVDEFELFVNERFRELMQRSRKYRISVLLAHQDHSMIYRTMGRTVLHSILSNAGSILVFQVGNAEAQTISREFINFTHKDFKTLDRYHLIARIDNKEHHAKANPPSFSDEDQAEQIIKIQKKPEFQFSWEWQ